MSTILEKSHCSHRDKPPEVFFHMCSCHRDTIRIDPWQEPVHLSVLQEIITLFFRALRDNRGARRTINGWRVFIPRWQYRGKALGGAIYLRHEHESSRITIVPWDFVAFLKHDVRGYSGDSITTPMDHCSKIVFDAFSAVHIPYDQQRAWGKTIDLLLAGLTAQSKDVT